MEIPRTRYAKSGDCHIAYQVVGDGPVDLLYVPNWFSQVEHLWEEPLIARFFERLAGFSRLILFDRRGAGLSDRMGGAPTLEEQMDDVLAVMRAAGSERAAVFAQAEGGPMAMLFAASFPERTTALALYSSFARTVRSDDIPWGNTPEQRAEIVEDIIGQWGEGTLLMALVPSLAGDERLHQWFGRLERLATSPGALRPMMDMVGQIDVRDLLPTIRVPTLVMHRRDDPFFDVRHSRYLAERIPGAKYVELEGEDSLIVAGDSEAILNEIEEFFTGARHRRAPDRVLATVMFTDIVDSTRRAAELGDQRWRQLQGRHDDLIRRYIDRFNGREVKNLGDGFLATFDGPTRAVRSALAITESIQPLGLEVRAGLHTGECEVLGSDVGGIAVNIGARVGALAGPGEVLVSSTVKDLAAGSGIAFDERGEHELKGVPGEWRLFAANP